MKKFSVIINKLLGLILIFIGSYFFILSVDQIYTIFDKDFWEYHYTFGNSIFGFMDLLTWQIVFAIFLFLIALGFIFYGYKVFNNKKKK